MVSVGFLTKNNTSRKYQTIWGSHFSKSDLQYWNQPSISDKPVSACSHILKPRFLITPVQQQVKNEFSPACGVDGDKHLHKI